MAKAFEALERRILELGTKSEDSVDLSELSLIGEGDERVIGFSLLGTDFLLTPSGDVVTVDIVDGEPQSYAVVDSMRASVHRFLSWRYSFIQDFGI